MEDQTKDLKDYLIILKKRRVGMISIMFTVILICTLVALLLPAKYKSSATILIEQQEIPKELVMSTVTSYAAERIQVIRARVMSRSNLMKIVDQYDLYPAERKRETTEEIMMRLQEDISLDIISADVVDPRTGRPTSATIAFSLSYNSESPAKAQKVASELTSLYLNENLKNRAQKAEETTQFFEQESERLSELINALESDLAQFKSENSDLLPGMQALNMQALQRHESSLSALETRLNTLEDKKFYLNGQLAMIDPGNSAVPGPQARLKQLETQYASLRSRYAEDHPDIRRIMDEIDSLRKEVGGSRSTDSLARELDALREQQSMLSKKYTRDHPDLQRTTARIAMLEGELESTIAQGGAEDSYFEDNPENPAYITLQAQLAGIESEIRSVTEQKQKLQNKVEALDMALAKAPEVEREYRLLIRDYDNATKEYQETRAKLARAAASRQLEAENKGERFTLIDPPALPERPYSPNRLAIMLLGVVLAVGTGLGFALVADAISGAVQGAKSVRASLGVSPLAVIPYQVNTREMQRRTRFRKRSVIVAFLAVCMALLLIHLLIAPLDVLWFKALRMIDGYM